MGFYDLHGTLIEDTYQRLLQITSGNTIVDGRGNDVIFSSITAVTITSTTLNSAIILSAGTDLRKIFAALSDESAEVHSVNSGTNIIVSGPSQNPVVNLVASPSVNAFTTSGITTINSNLIVTGTTSFGTGSTYTPIITNIANISASTAYQCQYVVYQNSCSVSGKINLSPVNVSAESILNISLPTSSNIVAEENCSGTANCRQFDNGGVIFGNITGNTAELNFICVAAVNNDMFFSFIYKIN